MSSQAFSSKAASHFLAVPRHCWVASWLFSFQVQPGCERQALEFPKKTLQAVGWPLQLVA
jgi:hypothetical protein